MISASNCLHIFMLICMISTFFFNSHLLVSALHQNNTTNPVQWRSRTITSFTHDSKDMAIEKISLEDNVRDEMNSSLVKRFRALLGLEESRWKKEPSPANNSEDHGIGNGAKSRVLRLNIGVVAAAAAVGAVLILFGVTIALLWKRRAKKSKISVPVSAASKVSFDPEPAQLYLNSLVENDYESKNVPSMNCDSVAISCSDEEIVRTASLSSDDESLKSSYDSHSPVNLVSNSYEANQSHSSMECCPTVSALSSNQSNCKPLTAETSIWKKNPERSMILNDVNETKNRSSIRHVPRPPPPPLPQKACETRKQVPSLSNGIEDGVPLARLKPLHWDKVKAAIDRSTVWGRIRSSSFELDEEKIKSLFAYNSQSSAANEVAKRTASPERHVLDHKRLQNITIVMKALSLTAEQVCNALINGRGLSVQQLEILAKMAPTRDEEQKFLRYKGDTSALSSAEMFIKTVLDEPMAFSRIKAMLFKEAFDDEVAQIQKSLEILKDACKQLRCSQLFLRLLEAVLKTGNRMNIGTIRGNARAFTLDALLKLADVKGIDGKTTLLHFVAHEIISYEENHGTKLKDEDHRTRGLDLISGFSTELSSVKKAASLDLDALANSVSGLFDRINKLKHLLENDLLIYERNSSSFVECMRGFVNHAEEIIEQMKSNEGEAVCQVRKIAKYYHGDMKEDEVNPLRIFGIVRDFLESLDHHVCKEIGSLKIH